MNLNKNMRKYLLLSLLLSSCSIFAINYPTYSGSEYANGESGVTVYTPSAEVPVLSPMLNNDGSAVTPYSEEDGQPVPPPSGPRHLKGRDDAIPVGSPVLPMLFMALLAAGAVYLRRRKALQA